MSIVIQILIAMSIPSGVTGLCFWLLQKGITRSEDRRELREARKEKCEVLMIQAIGASITLGEACAIALRDGRTNGETRDALAYAQKVKKEQRDFLTQIAAENIVG